LISTDHDSARPNEKKIESAPNGGAQIDNVIQVLDELSRQFAALPLLDTRSIDEIIGYDEFGVPK